MHQNEHSPPYQPIVRSNIDQLPQYHALSPEQRQQIKVVSAVFPFRTNRYVVDHLIDWADVPHDPMYQLTFPQQGMLSAHDYETIARLLRQNGVRVSPAEATDAVLFGKPGGEGTQEENDQAMMMAAASGASPASITNGPPR